MNLVPVLLTGLLAGGVFCAAAQGGLLAGLVTRQRSTTVDSRATTTRLADDLVPVGGFLAGKLTTHTALGALLGALGGTIQDPVADLRPRRPHRRRPRQTVCDPTQVAAAITATGYPTRLDNL